METYKLNKETNQITSFETTEIVKPFDREPLVDELQRIDEKISELEQRKTEIQTELDKYDQIVESAKTLVADKDGFVKIEDINLTIK